MTKTDPKMNHTKEPQKITSSFIPLWGILGVCFIVGQAVWNLSPLAIAPFQEQDLSTLQWIMYFAWLIFMGYSEGYRGFQKAFCPRVVRRAWTLTSSSPIHHILFAPLYSMGYFYATRKRQIVSWSVTSAIVGIVLIVKLLPYPYRNIVDGGVVFGLSYGLICLGVYTVKALQGTLPNVPPDLPTE